jgi:spore maturation protein CgeB
MEKVGVKPLRIFQVLESGANRLVKNNQTWRRNLHEPLISLGHDVFLFSLDEAEQSSCLNKKTSSFTLSEKLLEVFKRECRIKPFDLFFAYLKDGMVEYSVIDEIRKMGVLTCNFSCNNTHQFYLVDEISLHFDYNLHSEKDARQKFLNIGANPLWWPMASNPAYFKPMNIERDIEVSFVGANYGLRYQYIRHLLDNGVDTQVFGPAWLWGTATRLRSLPKRLKLLAEAAFLPSFEKRVQASSYLADFDCRRSIKRNYPDNIHPPCSDEDMIALYSRSHISLGFLEVYDNHDPCRSVKQHLHLREFEAPMSRALYCTGYLDELAEMFEPDKECLTYRSRHELLDKVRYYLKHPDEAEKIRQAGYKRALSDHTYHKRFQDLFNLIFK